MQREKRQPRRAIKNKAFMLWHAKVVCQLNDDQLLVWNIIPTALKLRAFRENEPIESIQNALSPNAESFDYDEGEASNDKAVGTS